MISAQISFHVSSWVGRLRKGRDLKKEFARFQAMKHDLAQVPPKGKNCLLVRLDDIGDFLLFVPTLRAWLEQIQPGKKMYFIGNLAWKDLFDYYFTDYSVECIWLNKNDWFSSSEYRIKFLGELASLSIQDIYFPSFTRVLLLEEIIRCQFQNAHSFGWQAKPSAYSRKLNEGFHFLLDSVSGDHELENNKHFFLATHPGKKDKAELIEFPIAKNQTQTPRYFIVCPGGNQGSKRWKAENWAQLAQQVLKANPDLQCRITGSKNDAAEGEKIRNLLKGFDAENYCGKTSLQELVQLSANAFCCLSNDTAQAHFCALQNVPTFVVVNGNRYGRFFPYPEKYKRVQANYPQLLNLSVKTHYDWEGKMPINSLKPEKLESALSKWLNQE